MPWMDESQNSGSSTDSVWLRFPQKIQNVGDRTEVKMRILAGDPSEPGVPVGVWVHWLQGKPFNCAGQGCPVCEARRSAPQDKQKTDFPLRSKLFFNVLVDEGGTPVVKVYSFGFGVSKDLKSFTEKYGDLRNYDITIRKEQVGRLPMNVDYSVFYEGKSELTEAQREAAQNLHDLSQFTKPASMEELKQVARGIIPVEGAVSSEIVSPGEMERRHLLGDLGELAKKLNLELKNFGVYDDTPTEKLQSLLNSLKGV